MNTRPADSSAARRAVILLSGGLDSYTAAAIARIDGFACYGLTILYGQRHQCEIASAQKVAAALRLADHKILNLDLRAFGGSALTDSMDVPKDHNPVTADAEIPITYVPARNTIFLSLALAWAETLGAFDIFIGANAVDYSGYPDCRPAFIAAFEQLANLATSAAVQHHGQFRIHAPLIHLSKTQIIQKGLSLGLDYGLTHSCYDPDAQGRPCGHCDSCQLRLKGFREAGLTDPADYQSR